MAKQIEGVYEKVLECAKTEFLTKGFKDASLRTIAQKAGTSTSSIYTRFKNKEALFHAIVSPVVDELKGWFIQVQENFCTKDVNYQKKHICEYTAISAEELVTYIYDNYDVFKLILECAEGTEFSDFLNQLVDIEVEYTLEYLKKTGNEVFSSGNISADFLHIISSSYFSGIFEIVLHDMQKEDGMLYAKQLRVFYYGGFARIYNW